LVQEEISKSPLQEEVTRSSGLVEDGTKCPNDKDQHPSLSPNTTCPAKSPNTVCPIKALEVEDPSWLVDNNRLRSLDSNSGCIFRGGLSWRRPLPKTCLNYIEKVAVTFKCLTARPC